METQCEALVSLLGADKVLFPKNPLYNESLLSYFSPQASAVKPLCFVLPKTVDDVSTIVKSLVSAGSCKFAVRGGGHMWFPGASISPGGVTVDLRGLNSLELSTDNGIIPVGVGATWDQVYAKLDPLGRSVAGGRVAGVGVGGLTLGGGLSYFGPQYGWTCNQAKLFEVVLADGSVVHASAQQNVDLWKGLRGGLNNFGIVTRIEFVTFEQHGRIWSTLTINPSTVVDEQAKIYANLMASDHYDERASFLTGWAFSPKAGGTVITDQLIYTEASGIECPPFYKGILDLPAIPSIGIPPVVASMGTHAKNSIPFNAPQAARYLMATTTFVPTKAHDQ